MLYINQSSNRGQYVDIVSQLLFSNDKAEGKMKCCMYL